MRTNIVIDDELIARAKALSGDHSKRETVEQALKLLVKLKSQEQARAWRGRLRWDGDLDAMRRDQ